LRYSVKSSFAVLLLQFARNLIMLFGRLSTTHYMHISMHGHLHTAITTLCYYKNAYACPNMLLTSLICLNA